MNDQRGAAYLSVIFVVVALFVWLTFELERTVQNQQTVAYNYGIVQAQYLAESGIEKLRDVLRENPEFTGPVKLHLSTGDAEAQVVSREPLQLRGIGKIEPDIQQTVYVELHPESLEIVQWWR